MSENIKFQSKWFEHCIRDYLKLLRRSLNI